MELGELELSDIEPEGLLRAAVKKSPYFLRKRKKRNQTKIKHPKRRHRRSPYFTSEEVSDGKGHNESVKVKAELLISTGKGVAEELPASVSNEKVTAKCKDEKSVDSPVVTSPSPESVEVKKHRHLLYPDFSPPQSPFGLVQEQLYKEPWKLLVATIFLNKTTGLAAKPILWEFLRLFPTPEATMEASQKELSLLFQPLGLHRKRASGIIRFSDEYLHKEWEYPMELYGIGKYGNDSYRIFCTPEWREVRPSDHWLNKYYAWLCEQNDYHPQDWSP